MNYKIYTLSDPITNEIRYVGQTIKSLNQRLNQHLICKKNSYRYSDYKIHIVEINTPPHKNERERTDYRSIYYCKYIFKAIIIEYRGLFYPAFNLTHYLGTEIYDVHEKCWNNVYISGKLTKDKHHFIKSYSDQLGRIIQKVI